MSDTEEYCLHKLIYVWNKEKDKLLKQTRKISFTEIVMAIQEEKVVDIIMYPNADKYPNQLIYLINLNNYIYEVLFIFDLENNEIFLKTIFPSRKYTQLYLNSEEQ